MDRTRGVGTGDRDGVRGSVSVHGRCRHTEVRDVERLGTKEVVVVPSLGKSGCLNTVSVSRTLTCRKRRRGMGYLRLGSRGGVEVTSKGPR